MDDARQPGSGARIPRRPRPTVVHNDFKLDNMMLDAADPGRVVAVLDWDMTTLGDPLIDVGTLLGYWPEASDPPERLAIAMQPTYLEGFPTRAEIVGATRAERPRPRGDRVLRDLRALQARGRPAADLRAVRARPDQGRSASPRWASRCDAWRRSPATRGTT